MKNKWAITGVIALIAYVLYTYLQNQPAPVGGTALGSVLTPNPPGTSLTQVPATAPLTSGNGSGGSTSGNYPLVPVVQPPVNQLRRVFYPYRVTQNSWL